MKKHWLYGKYVLRHKIAVYRAGRRLGVGRWQLLMHDLSKFRPDEWGPYAENFYGGPHRPWAEVLAYEKENYFDLAWRTSKEGVREAFDLAWLKHQRRNPHHWQAWVLREDSGKVKVLRMPQAYRLEMLADWMGAGMAIKGHGLDRAVEECRAWYENTTEGRQLHPSTRSMVEDALGMPS